jgi:hypothetical protein
MGQMGRVTVVCVAFALLAACAGGTTASAHPARGHGCSTPSNYSNVIPAIVAPGSRGVLYNGISWSHDGGRSWDQSPLCGGSVYGFSRAQPGLVYRVDTSGAFSRSTDGGVLWSSRGPSVGAHEEVMIFVDQKDPGTVCVQFSDRSSNPAGPLLSIDGGLHWTPGLECNGVARIGRGGPLVALRNGDPLLQVSTDGGTTWTPTPTNVDVSTWHAIASDPTRPGSLYGAGLSDPTWTYHSVDRGAHWTAITFPAGIDTAGVAPLTFFDPVRRGTIVEYQLKHLWVSRDTGATWKRVPQLLPSAPTGFDVAGDLYRSVGLHPRVSHDDGVSWTRRTTTR